MSFEITSLDDHKILMEINNNAVPDVNPIDLQKASWLVANSIIPGLALMEEKVAGVVVVLGDHSTFESEFYRWFTAHYENFLYIDRIIVAQWARGFGVARKLYQQIDDIAQQRGLAVAADVYSEPPNIPSLALHRAFGFIEVGSQYIPAEGKTAAKFMKYEENATRKM